MHSVHLQPDVRIDELFSFDLFSINRDRGLAIRDKRGDVQELADVSIACRAPITTANFSINGYLWTVQYNKIDKERREVFIKKSDNEVGHVLSYIC